MERPETETTEEPGEDRRAASPLERPIALAAPLLDLLLWAGDRVSRLAGPVDHEYYPVRSPDGEDPGTGEDRDKDDR